LVREAFPTWNCCEGKIVQVGDGKLTMTNKDGASELTHKVKADAKIIGDGKKCASSL
jgi:hypothetical protein